MHHPHFSAFTPRALRLWQVLVIIGTGCLLFSLTGLPRLGPSQFWQFTTLTIVALLSTRLAFLMPGGVGVVSPADAFVFLIGLFFGAPTATLTGAASGFIAARQLKRPLTEAVFNASVKATSTLAAFTTFYHLLSHDQLIRVTNLFQYQSALGGLEWTLLSSAVMVLSYFVLTSALTAIFQGWQRQQAVSELWVHNHLWASLHIFVSGFAAILVSLLVESYGQLYILAIAPMVAAGFATCRTWFDKVAASARHLTEMQRLHLAMAEALARALAPAGPGR